MRFNGSLIAVSSLTMLAAACSAASDIEGEHETVGTQASAWRGEDHDGRYGRHDDDDCDGRGTRRVHATVVATGIPGAGAVVQVGSFLRSSPYHDRATFQPYVAPGGVANAQRLFVASTSNFGAPLARADQFAGTVLSIDSTSSAVSVPPTFAAAGGQASAAGGAVIVYTANNPAFLNSVYEPQAVTANEVGASFPTGISLNNGNGRPWVANAPTGASGDGTVSVLDPMGAPLAGAPSVTAGGVFAGDRTNRAGATHGMTGGSLGTAILTKSPDGTGRAVFVTVQADGAIEQVHVLKGVTELAPPGTITKFKTLTPALANSTSPSAVTRVGIAFNWVPNRTLYITDPQADKVVAIDITDDGTFFHAATPRRFGHRGDFDIPIDVQPTMPEVASENFASNSTLAGGADLYVLNRGDNTIVRMREATGEVVARRRIEVDGQPGWRANGMAVSPDGKTIFVTGQTPGNGGVVARLAAFGDNETMTRLMGQAAAAGATTKEQLGSFFFNKSFGLEDGVGPLYNAQSCVACHGAPIPGGMSSVTEQFFSFDNDNDAEVARAHSVRELGDRCRARTGPPRNASFLSKRSSMTLRSTSLIDFVLPTEILNNMAAEPADVRGRPNYLSDGRIGRFGWKGNVPTLVEFMGAAYRNEQGLTNNLQPEDLTDACDANEGSPEIDARPIGTTPSFLATIDAPAPAADCLGSAGAAVFQSTGCASCHKASFPGPGFTAYLYSDLLLHDMGPDLADGMVMGSASGSEFRTMTLVKLNERSHFLHDARANTPEEAILAHGGQAATSKNTFVGLSSTDKANLLGFLGCL